MKFSERTKTPKLIFALLVLLSIFNLLAFNLIFFACTIAVMIPFIVRYRKAPLVAFGLFPPLVTIDLLYIMPFYHGYSRFTVISSKAPELLIFFTITTIIEILICLFLLFKIKRSFTFSFFKLKNAELNAMEDTSDE